MSDPYANLAAEDDTLQHRIAAAMEARCIEPAQIAIRSAYLGDLELPKDALAVEFGSGTGHVTQNLIDMAGATQALGIEPSPVMVKWAKKQFGSDKTLRFEIGNAKNTKLADGSVDMVLMHTLLCHVPEPKDVIMEAMRVLKPGGVLAVCDGDYSTATCKIAEFDPLDQLVRFMIQQNVTDLWIMRQMTQMLTECGFQLGVRRGHSYLASGDASYFMTVIERGADKLVENGILCAQTAEAMKSEAHTRLQAGTFFGFMSYVSQIARKPRL